MGPAEPVPGSTDDETWRDLLVRAKLQGLSPLLYAALETHGFVNVPAFVVEALQDIYRKSALAAAVAHHEMETLVAQLAEQGIDVIVLKGAALSKWLYPQPGLRPFGDLDLLIHPTDRAAVSSLLNTCKYQEVNGMSVMYQSTFACETLFNRTIPPRQSVDLHWQILNRQFYRRRMRLDWFWEHTQPLISGPVTGRMFDPTAQSVYLALHLGLHHGNAPRLIHLYDLALLIHKYKEVVDWQAAASYVQETGIAYPIDHIFRQTCAAWQIAPAPETLSLFRPRAFHFSEFVAFQFATAIHSGPTVLMDAFNIGGARNKLRLALALLVPDAAYMRQRYVLAPNTFLPCYYALRLGQSLWKFVRSVWWAFLR